MTNNTPLPASAHHASYELLAKAILDEPTLTRSRRTQPMPDAEEGDWMPSPRFPKVLDLPLDMEHNGDGLL